MAVEIFQCVHAFCHQFNKERKSLEVTIDLSVSGTVELLDMITDPKVSLKKMEGKKGGNCRKRKCDGHVLPFSRKQHIQRNCTSWVRRSRPRWSR